MLLAGRIKLDSGELVVGETVKVLTTHKMTEEI